MSNLPEPKFAGVLTLSSSCVIDAPIEKVWGILCNFQSYSEWNEFVHAQVIVDGKTKKPLPDQTPREGTYLLMDVFIPPSADLSRSPSSRPLEIITAVDPTNHRIAWQNCMPAWLVSAERWQVLSVVEDGKTLYETREVMGGIAAYIIKWFMYTNLMKGFQAVADGLKKRAEQLQR
ncbi:hypothetical protein DAEQUDRAFT_728312 [Daedalea quercina L-15889]|uniref:Coenzyme Q-binding protein COQ10 START domain-containing protein n=1 Tax=Daedalea quercina L-15889 TaxID=1314783 RepID=A0A165PD14_9APHY|nr:hypothetical protein DAEQUDRAFT_728312 [Daedalea quercina L-15889]